MACEGMQDRPLGASCHARPRRPPPPVDHPRAPGDRRPLGSARQSVSAKIHTEVPWPRSRAAAARSRGHGRSLARRERQSPLTTNKRPSARAKSDCDLAAERRRAARMQVHKLEDRVLVRLQQRADARHLLARHDDPRQGADRRQNVYKWCRDSRDQKKQKHFQVARGAPIWARNWTSGCWASSPANSYGGSWVRRGGLGG